ncbi:MAG: hypothetical protein Alis3KO_00680 [Aliiglaciecola sp.]
MATVDTMRPEKRTQNITSVSALKKFLNSLPDEVDDLEESYEVTHYQINETGERWLGIEPTR